MKSFAVAAVALAFSAASLPAMAADQTINLSGGSGSFTGSAPLLAGGDDLITFTGLPAGTYSFVFSLSSQSVTGLTARVNGQLATTFSAGPVSFASLVGTGTAPFSVLIGGTPGATALYSGELTVTLVPEPSTYAMLLAGLGIFTLVARRRA